MDLISKKELLEKTGISYGQLYRWKRARLIPEEWFKKQSSYTGQETFFPREAILERVASILDSKDHYSLEEIAEMFSKRTTDITLSLDDLGRIDEIDKTYLKTLGEGGKKTTFQFSDVVLLASLTETLAPLNLPTTETTRLVTLILSTNDALKNTATTCILFMTGEVYHILLLKNTEAFCFDETIRILSNKSLEELSQRLKLKYQHSFQDKFQEEM